MLSSDLPDRINEAAAESISAVLERLLPGIGPDFDHCHLALTSSHRWTEEGELLVYGVEINVTACTRQTCQELDDGGVGEWLKLPVRAVVIDPSGRPVRSDEQMAAAAIQSLMPECRVEKIPESEGSTDLLVTFPDQRKALVEVTMHTDSGKRSLQKAKPKPLRGDLRHDWHIRLLDARGKGWYGHDDDLDLRQLQPILLEVFERVERDGSDLDDHDLIINACREAIAGHWHNPSTEHDDHRPLLAVVSAEHCPPLQGAGTIAVTVGPCTSNFRNVVDVADLKSALQERIAHKLAKNQWGDTPHRKWLAVVLDESEAATQLVGDAFEFEDHTPDFSDLDLTGLDEVWAITLHDKKLVVLRFVRFSDNWQHRADLEVA